MRLGLGALRSMPTRRARYVLVYAKKSRVERVGNAITYDKNGKIGLFHKRSKVRVEAGDLVVCKVIVEKENFIILKPVYKVTDGRIPREYEPVEVWGRPAYRKLKSQRLSRAGRTA